MKGNFLTAIAVFIFSMTFGFQAAWAQAQKTPAKETSLIAHLVKEAKQPDSHTADDIYLRVTIGKIAYVAELGSGKIVSRSNVGTESASGGFSGGYAEVSLNLLSKNKKETAQGASQILKQIGDKWQRIALSESDYQCADVKIVPKAVLKALKVECF